MCESITLTKLEQARYRKMARMNRCPVVVVSGESAPKRCGEEGYHTFRKSGGISQYPHAALRAGYKLDYHPSTRRVEVSAEFVRLDRARTKMRKAPIGVVADWLDDQGYAVAAAMARKEMA